MLYNPNWKSYTRQTEVVSFDGLIEWLKTKDPKETYNFDSCNACLFRQYLDARGSPALSLANKIWFRFWAKLHNQPFSDVAVALPHTFGAALARAESLREMVGNP